MKGNAVIKTQRTDGQIEAQAEAPIVVHVTEVEVVGFGFDIADVVKGGDAHSVDDGDAVLGRAEPISIAADGFAKPWLSRADAAIAKAAHGISAAQIKTFVKGDIDGIEALSDASASD